VNPRKKALHVGAVFIALMIVSGLVLMYTGNDAVVLAMEKKDGILTAEQVKLAFDSVGGRLVKEGVKEGQRVKKGDVVMALDSTDTDLAIERLKAQIAQTEAQIKAADGNMNVSFLRADNDEQQTFRQIDQQRGAVRSAEATLANRQLDYDRKVQLLAAGAVSQSEVDNAQMNLSVAGANLAQQEQLLQKLLSGASDSGVTDAMNLPTIRQERQAAANMANDVESMRQQKNALEVQLKELEVAKTRLTLKAPEDGKIIGVLAKEGEMVAPNTPVLLLESDRAYYDIYISEEQAVNLNEGDEVIGTTVAGKKTVRGKVRLLTQAPGFADLKQSREKAQADLTSFQVRIYVEPQEGVRPGMTIGVNTSELAQK